jgi:glycine/sarcosine N-methyltransferase
MSDPVRAFYDDLAGQYHLLFADWPASMRYQADLLDRLIQADLGPGPHMVLDAACGIGTQAIGLALRGYQVRATDLSSAAIARLRHESEYFAVSIDASVADLRTVDTQVSGRFDAVIACDNALPHLLTDDDLEQAVAAISAKLRHDGLFLVSLRDYDQLRRDRPQTQPPRVFDDPDGRRIAFQIWDWSEDGTRYRLHQFLLQQHNGEWRTTHVEADYRALLRGELGAIVERAGLTRLHWHEPETSGYYQPILTARRRE